MVQAINRNPDYKKNEKSQPEDNNTQSIDANNKDSDIQESAQASSQYKIKRWNKFTRSNDTDIQESSQDSNARSINESGMVQDSELPKSNNLNI